VARTITPACSCEVCSKPTSRLLGFAAGLLVDDETPSSHIAALGYCAAHRDRIPELFVARAAAKGTVHWMPDAPVELRPADVEDFLATAARVIHQAGVDAGFLPPLQEVRSMEDVSKDCRHCGHPISWGTGPHVEDAAARPGRAAAWECRGCGATGILG
jgi:hypothetical protein